MKIHLLIAHISSVSVLIPFGLALIQWNKLPANIAPIRWLLIISAICDLTLFVFHFLLSKNVNEVARIFMFLQFTLLLYMLGGQLRRKRILTVIYALIVFLYAVGLLLLKDYAALITAFDTVSSLILIIVPILFFIKLLHELKVTYIHRQPILWIAFATLFYYSGNLFVFLSSNYLLEKTGHFGNVWIQHNILNITKNILFAVALWQNYRTMKSSA